MAEEGFKRKLTAILNADAVDYVRLVNRNFFLHLSFHQLQSDE